MKLLNIVALATLMTFGSGTSALAQQPKFHRHLSRSYLPRSHKAAPQQEFVDATIRDINYVQGLLTLETDIGVMQVQLRPEETLDLHVGDKLRVRLLSGDRIEA
jgi:hypothetical protein